MLFVFGRPLADPVSKPSRRNMRNSYLELGTNKRFIFTLTLTLLHLLYNDQFVWNNNIHLH